MELQRILFFEKIKFLKNSPTEYSFVILLVNTILTTNYNEKTPSVDNLPTADKYVFFNEYLASFIS